METNRLMGRNYYAGSGQVDWGRFLPGVLLALVASAILAGVMFLLYRLGFFLVVIVPLLAALGAGFMVRLAVQMGHCRSAIAGALAGLLAGLTLFLGYYYIGMVYHLGAEYATQPERLPDYIRLRIAHSRLRSSHDWGGDRDRQSQPTPGMNWFTFIFHAAIVLGLTTVAGWQRARKPYCETCRRWLLRETTSLEPSKSDEFVSALQSASEHALAKVLAGPAYAGFPALLLAVDYCPTLKEGRSQDCAAFLSAKTAAAGSGGAGLDPFDAAKGKLLVPAVQLRAGELPALALRFPAFESLVGSAALSQLRELEPAAPAAAEPDAPAAEVRPVESHSAGRVLTRRRIILGNLLSLLNLGGVLGGVGLIVWGGMTAFPDKKGGPVVTDEEKVRGVALMVVGGVLLVGTLGYSLVDSSMGGNAWLRRSLRRELARRPSPWVDPNDPDALFVEVVPKSNWNRVMLETASDVGFLVVDRSRREVRFEGDKERYRVPGAAITSCEVENYTFGSSGKGTTLFFVVIQARKKDGLWQVPMRERRGAGRFRKRQKQDAEKLSQRIREITTQLSQGLPL